MNLWKYTFSGKFLYYASIAAVVAIVVMLSFLITGNTREVWFIFYAYLLLFGVSITGQLLRWLKYKNFRNKALIWWGDKTRLN